MCPFCLLQSPVDKSQRPSGGEEVEPLPPTADLAGPVFMEGKSQTSSAEEPRTQFWGSREAEIFHMAFVGLILAMSHSTNRSEKSTVVEEVTVIQ